MSLTLQILSSGTTWKSTTKRNDEKHPFDNFQVEVFLQEILWIRYNEDRSGAMLKHNTFIKLKFWIAEESLKERNLRMQSIFRPCSKVSISELWSWQKYNLRSLLISNILADKTAHFLRFVAVDYWMKCVQKSPFSGCTSSRYQQRQ